ncbi:hypothetical protein ACOACO_17505 [Nocardioides sp. CPCC 205120]|uniref:hypothetical protein n=1 Tax=Nocardioides sp. CPCC 205120 TaxID=3406462 RepID=UPI003B5122E0
MSAALAPIEVIHGSQEPTHRCDVKYDHSFGDLAIELAESAGLQLDQWQQDLLVAGLGQVDGHDAAGNPAQRWAAFEVGVELSRQNGKSVVFEARVLAGLFLLREQLIIYSAHEGETAIGAFNRIEALIKANPELHAEVKNDGRSSGFRRTNGQNSITLTTGQVVKFRTRTKGGGRGLSGDCVILDEAQDLQDDHIAALFPVLSARPNPQLWYGGSAGTKKSTVQARLVRRAERRSPRLVYWRWASPDHVDLSDPHAIARVNPAVGKRQSMEFLMNELEALGPTKFGQERMGIGDYPREEGEDWVVPRVRWDRAGDPQSEIEGPIVFVPEVKWDRTRTSINVAGRRRDGRIHIECIASAPGSHWAAAEIARLRAKHETLAVALNPAGASNALVGPLSDLGVEVDHLISASDAGDAYALMYDGLMGDEDVTSDAKPDVVHRTSTILTSAMAAAEVRTSSATGATSWRVTTGADSTAIIGCSYAALVLQLLEKPKPPGLSPVAVSDTDTPAEPSGAVGGFNPLTARF